MNEEFDANKRIEEIMEENRWTQYILSKRSGIAQSTIASWYSRKSQPTIIMIIKICIACGMTPDEFFQVDSDFKGSNREYVLFHRIFCLLSDDEKHFIIGVMEYIEQWLQDNRSDVKN